MRIGGAVIFKLGEELGDAFEARADVGYCNS